ncbi:alcohol dehydrogenase [Cocos nucifera]|uniref:Alcohol dehydrogenase n=1 Tax=Cocos nucifera TaxID=13894 RepID=A0A8K0INQ2_COCNU|nr:alcohol dehydrogenase [Cocos nucifera]
MAFFCSASRSLLRRHAKLHASLWRSLSGAATKEERIDAAGYHVAGGPSFMRGAVFWEPNRPLTTEEFHMPRPKAGELLIKTKACGVCHSDLHVMKGELPFSSPCVVGHEITGEVVDHGAHTDTGVIKRFPIGSHVVGAFIMPCGNCFFCVKGQEDLCEAFFAYNRAKGTLYDGETRLFLRSNGKPVYMYSMGGLAEYCVVPANALAVLPNSLPYTESAILGCAVFTAYGAMRHAAEMRAGDSVALHLHLNLLLHLLPLPATKIAKAFGAAEIIAVDVLDEKLQSARMLGATHTINALKEDVVDKIKEITGGLGVDVAVEALGKPLTFMQCTKSVRDGGKAVMIGLAPTNAMGEVDITRLVRRQFAITLCTYQSDMVNIVFFHMTKNIETVKIIGSYGARARQDLPQLVKLAETGIFNLQNTVSRKCKFEEANSAYEDLDRGKIVGRAVVEIM